MNIKPGRGLKWSYGPDAYQLRFLDTAKENEALDFDLWSVDPARFEGLMESHGIGEPAWVGHMLAGQQQRLRTTFKEWLADFTLVKTDPQVLSVCVVSDPRHHGRRTLRSAPTVLDRMDDDAVERAIYALIDSFMFCAEPHARALGVPVESIVWPAMMGIEVMKSTYSAADIPRVVGFAADVWAEFGSVQFDSGEAAEAFLFKVVDIRCQQLTGHCLGTLDEPCEGLTSEYQLLVDFCDFIGLYGWTSQFGRAVSRFEAHAPKPTDFAAFCAYAVDAIERFEASNIEYYVMF